jgi:hypothetical protein
MMRLAIAALCAVPSLTACGPTADELRQVPPRFTVTIADYWERIAICLTDAYGSGLHVPDNRHIGGERRAEVFLQIRGQLGQEFNVAMFDIRGIGRQRESTVAFRQRATLIKSTEMETEARERVERCKSALTGPNR